MLKKEIRLHLGGETGPVRHLNILGGILPAGQVHRHIVIPGKLIIESLGRNQSHLLLQSCPALRPLVFSPVPRVDDHRIVGFHLPQAVPGNLPLCLYRQRADGQADCQTENQVKQWARQRAFCHAPFLPSAIICSQRDTHLPWYRMSLSLFHAGQQPPPSSAVSANFLQKPWTGTAQVP